jgi:hypothetical protein
MVVSPIQRRRVIPPGRESVALAAVEFFMAHGRIITKFAVNGNLNSSLVF